MPVRAICTAEYYDLDGLAMELRRDYSISPLNLKSVLHARSASGNDIFIFRNGSFVIWGTEYDSVGPNGSLSVLSDELRKSLRHWEASPIPEERVEQEDMAWRVADNGGRSGVVGNDTIEVLPSQMAIDSVVLDHGIYAKLAFSNGLANSVELAVLERLLERHIERVREIPIALEHGKRIPVGRAESLCLIGELLHFRAALNLDSGLLDTPDIYWSQPELEDLYKTISRTLDTRQRISILNKKMDYAEKLAELLRSHLNEAHMFRLEWAIIILVGFEVVNSVMWWMV